MTELLDVIRLGTTRGLDFVVLDELRKRTGINLNMVLRFALSEILCNALDKNATHIDVSVKNEGEFFVLSITDNGSKKLSLDDIRLILDFENKASSKRGILRVSRGYLGNALKCIFGYSYALAESEGLTPPPIIVSSGLFKYEINLKPNRVAAVIESEIRTQQENCDDGYTKFTVMFPKSETSNETQKQLIDIVTAASMVNPTRYITYDIFDCASKKLGLWQGSPKENSVSRQETSVLWYTQKQFEALFEDYIRATPETPLHQFMALFRGFTGKAVIRENLQELSAPNHDSATNANLQFLPSTPIKDVSKQAAAKLFSIMRGKSKPIGKRSIPNVLSTVGRESFEKLQSYNGWTDLKYVTVPGVRNHAAGRYQDQVEYPFLFEAAVFKRTDNEGLKIYQCVNFMASTDNLFGRMYNIDFHIGQVGITKDHPVTVVVHFVCPVLSWLNYGKSGLDDDTTNFIPFSSSDSPGEVLAKVMKALLPIPKTPRVWHPPPPPKPYSWVPHGKVGNSIYEDRLKLFADEIKAINAEIQRIRRDLKFGPRGWCYRLEDRIAKDEFDACEKAIGDCRKTGLIPILGFIKEDQDETRRFSGLINAIDPASYLRQIVEDVESMLQGLLEHNTDFWKGEKYFLMMLTEKGDIKNLFESICREYHVPIASTKGWSPIEIRAIIAELCKKAEANDQTPVLLLFYDLDPAGRKITKTFRKNLRDCERGTHYDPGTEDNPKLMIERFGLNKEDVEKYGLTWINNLKSASGKEVYDPDYEREVGGRRKCESNALFKNDKTLEATEVICRNAIEKYYGADAKIRFKQKEEATRSKLSEIYDDPVWSQFSNSLSCLIKSYAEKETEQIETPEYKSEENVVFIDNKYYGRCPNCSRSFNYSEDYVGKLVRCRHCDAPMRLKRKEAQP